MMKKDNTTPEQKLDIEDIKAQLVSLQEEVEHNLSGWRRAQADYQNLKRETEQARIDTIKLANKSLIETLIPIFDNFALAIKHLPQDLEGNSWVDGIVFIHKQMQEVLMSEGVEIINPIGEEFNPNLHEAVDSVETDEGSKNTIVEVLQVGYSLNGSLIRSARVKVSA